MNIDVQYTSLGLKVISSTPIQINNDALSLYFEGHWKEVNNLMVASRKKCYRGLLFISKNCLIHIGKSFYRNRNQSLRDIKLETRVGKKSRKRCSSSHRLLAWGRIALLDLLSIGTLRWKILSLCYICYLLIAI